ncbi:hypothetical protein F503_05167 [Ophiostoma piceae UAMH 11346]|uniref:Swi5-dependent recombination DNA repair protein 1 n=1 Tax=Ophiostoma piceae (strain UAMH 11346) TaxID=1262450 RepID=S3CAY7_OPHP1|nr:hypothetical protein F503_05167 [Ophiostoma piceae UAMH 11346]
MLTPAAKRRRAEAASATLSRPFRSPAVRGKPTEIATAPRSSLSLGRNPEETESPERKYKRPRQSSLSGLPSSQLKLHPTRSVPQTPLSLDSLIDQYTLQLDAGDETIKEAQHAARRKEDERQAQAAKSADKAKQSNIYDEMPVLIAKWREAGRLAAEEVYEFVAKRIAGAGGIKAWQAMAAPPPPEEDQECFKRRDDDEEECAYEREQADERREEEKQQEEEKSQNFTMAMMLASLNVEPDLLAYDEVEERWKD